MELRSYIDDRRVQLTAAFILVLAVGFVGSTFGNLGNNSSHEVRQQADSYDAAPSPTSLDLAASGGRPAESDAAGKVTDERKKATRISLDLRVDSVESSQNRVRQLAENSGGLIESSRYSKRYSSTGHMSIRIPENKSQGFLEEVESEFEVESRSTDTDDVTDTYTETSLELKNKRQELQKLEKMMNETEKVDSLIKIQERMSELRSRIQYLENRLEKLDQRTDYTRINVDFQQKESFTSEFKLRKTVTESYRGVFESLRFMIVGLGYLIPFGLVYLLYRGGKRLKSRLEDRF